jgi:hypothetical protein
MKELTLLFVFVISIIFDVPAENPSVSENTLFVISRSKDLNEVHYVLKTTESAFKNSELPIDVYWIKRGKGDIIEPLTWVQNNYSYGIKPVDYSGKRNKEWAFQFVSYPKRTFWLRKLSSNNYKVLTTSDKGEIIISSIYVKMDGGTFWLPNIKYVRMNGEYLSTGQKYSETIYP